MLDNKSVFALSNNMFFENNVEVFIPELWANESLAILVENMVAGNLVYRDFENVLQKYGDVVNVSRPGELEAKRKTNADPVVIQDATATNVQVPLNQHIHVSILIKDGEESKSFKNLVDEFLRPQVIGIARFIDKMVLGQWVQFLNNNAGQLNGLTGSNARQYLLGLRQTFNQNKAPLAGRNMVLNPVTETSLLNTDLFTQAQIVGDFGQALRDATLGRKLGWDFWMDQNMASVAATNTTYSGTVNNSGGYAAGTTTMTVATFANALANGTWFTVVGDGVPHQITASVGGSTPTSITFTPALSNAVANSAAISAYVPGAINYYGGYPRGYAKELTINGFTVAPQIGQLVSFTLNPVGQSVYSIIDTNGLVGITLDRPLDVGVNNGDPVNIGPAGNYNFAFHRNAIALVTRPLALPMLNTGARAAIANFNNLAMRICITYSGEKQGHLVTVDMLAGIAVLDTRLGGVLLG